MNVVEGLKVAQYGQKELEKSEVQDKKGPKKYTASITIEGATLYQKEKTYNALVKIENSIKVFGSAIKSNSPQWAQKFTLVYPDNDSISLRVYNKGLIFDSLVGVADLQPSQPDTFNTSPINNTKDGKKFGFGSIRYSFQRELIK